MSASNRPEELWEQYLQASRGSYERSSFLDVFLADFLRHMKDGKSAKEILKFSVTAGVASLIACDLVTEVHKICSQPSAGDEFEDLSAVRKFLLNGPGWRTLAVLNYIGGVHSFSCGRELASLLITIYPLCMKRAELSANLSAINPYVLCKNTDSIEDLLKKPATNRKLSYGPLSAGNAIEYNRSQSNTSTSRLRRRRSTHSCASLEGAETSESEQASDDAGKLNTLKIRLNPMDFDYFTSVVRSDDEARLESENYSPKKKVIRDEKKVAQDYIDNDIRDVLSYSLSENDFFHIFVGLLQSICINDQNATTLYNQPVGIIILNFVMEDLCSLQFDSVSLGDFTNMDIAERKASFSRLLNIALEKVLLNEEATTTAIQRGILPVMIKILEDVVRKFPISPRGESLCDQGKYSHEFVFGLSYTILSFLYHLLLQRGSIGKINDFLLLFQLVADSQSGRLIEKSIMVILSCQFVDRQLQVSRTRRLIEFVGHLIDTMKKVRTDVTHTNHCRSKRHRQCGGLSTEAHHHQFLFGSTLVASLAGTVSKNPPECSVASMFAMLVRLLRSLPSTDGEAITVTLNVMSNCGTCCCFPPAYLLKPVAQILQKGVPKTRLVCLVLLERSLYWELGAFERPYGTLPCKVCHDDDPVHSRNSPEFWSCLDLFTDMLLSRDAKLRQAITSHLLKVAARFTVGVKSKLLFGIFYPVFLKAKGRLAQDDKLAQYTVLSCLSLFTSLLWNAGFAAKFIHLQGLNEILQLIVTPTLSELCCSILEITAITDIGSLENAEKDLPTVTSVHILRDALVTATSRLMQSIAEKKTSVDREAEQCDKKNCSANVSESDYRNLSISDMLKLEGCDTMEKSYLLTILKACVFWRSCANLTVGSPRYRAYIGRHLDDASGHALLRLLASLIAAGTAFTGVRCRNLEIHLYIKLLEALLIVNVASGLTVDERVAQVNACTLAEVRRLLLASCQCAHLQQICDALVTCSMTQICTNQEGTGAKPRPGALMVALPAEPDCLTDDELDETYLTADEGYDADVEVLAMPSDEGGAGGTARPIAHARLVALAVELLVAAKRPQVAVHCLHRLIAVSREHLHNCLALATNGLISMLLVGFHHELSTCDPEHDELRKAILELVVLLARNRILPHELILYLRLFTAENPPLDSLLGALVNLVSWCIPRPHMILAFPTAIDESLPIDRPAHDNFIRRRFFREQNVVASWSHCAMSIPIRSQLGWSMWAAGFSVGLWLSVNSTNASASPGASTNASAEPTHAQRRPSANSADDESSDEVAGGSDRAWGEQLHLFSVGTDQLMVEAWLNGATLAITLKLSKGVETICQGTKANLLQPGRWTYLAFNVTTSVFNKRNLIEVRILVDGVREDSLTMSMSGLVTRRPCRTEVLLGSAVPDPSQSRSWYLGNVMLFRSPVWTRERALYMVGLGPNYGCLADCATHHQAPNFTGVFAGSLPYGFDWPPVFLAGKAVIAKLKEQVLMTYAPHPSHIVNLYPLCTSQSSGPLSGLLPGAAAGAAGAAAAAAVQIPITVTPTLLSVIDCRQYQGLVAAATMIGGAPVFLFLCARVVELDSSEEEQANAVYVLLKLVQSDSELFSQFESEHCGKLLLRMFLTKQCHIGHHLLKAILDVCCDKPVLSSVRAPNTFQVCAGSDAILVQPSLLAAMVAVWSSFQHPGCPAGPGLTVLATLLHAMLVLIRDEHPFRQFNAYQLNHAGFVPALIGFAKERFLYKEDVPLPLSLCEAMVELIRLLLGSPPDLAYLTDVMDFILLLHPPQATYVTHSDSNFYCLLHSKGTTKSENVSLEARDGAEGEQVNNEVPAPEAQEGVGAEGGHEGREGREVRASCHYVVEELLVVVRNAVLLAPDCMTQVMLEEVVRMPVLITLANHPDAGTRAAVIMLIASHLQRSGAEVLSKFASTKGFYLVANQLGLHPATRPVVDACMWLVTCCQVSLRDMPWSHADVSASASAPQSLVLVLAALPGCARDVALAHDLTLFLRNIYVQAPPDNLQAVWRFAAQINQVECCMFTPITVEVGRKMLLDLGLVEVLLKTVIAVCHVKRVQREDTGLCDQDLLIEDLRLFLIAIVTSAIYATGSQKMQLLNEMCLQLRYLEQRERDNCTDSTRCVMAVRDTQCMLLEAALDIIQNKILSLEPKTNYNVSSSSVLMLAASLRLEEDKQKSLSRGELADRYNAVLIKAVEFLISSECVGESSSLENSFARRLLSTMLRGMCSMADRAAGQRLVWNSVMWSAKSTLRIQTSSLLVWMLSPENLISTRLFAVNLLRAEPKLKEFITEIFKNSTQIEEKFCVFLWELMNNNAETMQSPDKRCCHDLRVQLENWGLMSTSLGDDVEVAKDLVQLLVSEMRRFRRAWHAAMSVGGGGGGRMDELVESTRKSAAAVTRSAVQLQNVQRKALIDAMKAALSESAQVRARWAKLVRQLTHERAVWCFPQIYPNCWQLDATEGPGRVRTRLSRCHLKLDRRYLMDEHPHVIAPESGRCGEPLSYLFELEPASSASSELTERLHTKEKISHMSAACVVTPAREVSGELLVGEACLYFVGDASQTAGPELDTAWHFRSIKEILKRRFQLKERAVEIFLTNGTTYLVAFQSARERDSFLDAVIGCDLPNRAVANHLEDAKQLWREGLLTNWEYLTQLNKMAGRSYNDLMQYPVFPFVLADYRSVTLDLTQPGVYRNLKKPMAVQDKKNEQHYINNYNYFKQELLEGNQLLSAHSEPFHYGSHYSNSGTVLHFLVRLPPFTSMFLTYQDNNFDLPDRTFHSMHTTWRLASSDSTTDVKELIPEFFYLPEFLENKECFNFGVRQNGIRVNDVELPPWCGGNARLFVLIHRQALEAAHVRENLPHWLDLIFGFKQTGKAAIDAINVFHPATYCGFEVESIVDPLERSAWETMVKTYGQTPRQLLTAPHPMVVQALAPHTSKSAIREVLPNVKGLVWGSYVGSPSELEPIIAWNCYHRTPITAFEMLPTNEVFGLAQSSSLLVSFSKEKGLGYMNPPTLQGVALITWGHADMVLRIKIKKDQIPMPIIRFTALDPVSICATTPECNQLWMGHESGKIVVYTCRMELAKGQAEFGVEPTTLWGHSACITCLRLGLGFSIAVSGSLDNTLVIWDLNKVSYVRTLVVGRPVNVVTISPTLGDIAIASENVLECYTLNAAPIGTVLLEPSQMITALCYSNAPEGLAVNVVAAGLATGLIRLWSSWDLSVVRDLSTPLMTKPVTCITYSADGQHLYAASIDGIMVIWERPGAKAANKSPKFSNLTFL